MLVEDGSRDNSLAACQELAAAHAALRLRRHPAGKNHGAGASRNRAIRKSTGQCVAFLDADDYFLVQRAPHESAIPNISI
jgi:glycosyltransferase involved in cell wall biosynthesis